MNVNEEPDKQNDDKKDIVFEILITFCGNITFAILCFAVDMPIAILIMFWGYFQAAMAALFYSKGQKVIGLFLVIVSLLLILIGLSTCAGGFKH